jgi:hypothetical protein
MSRVAGLTICQIGVGELSYGVSISQGPLEIDSCDVSSQWGLCVENEI